MLQKKHLKKWVVPTLLVIMVVMVIGISAMISQIIFSSINGDTYSYVLRDLISTELPVNTEVTENIIKPYASEEVKIHIGFYDVNAKKEDQEKALILYNNTYMPNTGVLYGSDKNFEILAIYDGEVTSVTQDDVFGYIIEIKHNNNLISKYSSLAEVNVQKGDKVEVGEVIGMSGANKLVSVSQNMLLFEIVYNGANINPETIYEKNIREFEQ